MSLHSSSTSGSEFTTAPNGKGGRREALVVAAWALLFLAAGDVAVGRRYALPADRMEPSNDYLVEFFNAGRSIEAKLRRGVGPTDKTSTPLMRMGWLKPKAASWPGPWLESDLPPGVLPVSFYGMSYTADVANELTWDYPNVRARIVTAPNSPASHSYAMYALDHDSRSEVVVLGVLGSGVQDLVANSMMNRQVDYPSPFTYPRFFSEASGREPASPLVGSLADLRDRLADPPAWEAYVAEVRATDPFYSEYLFRSDVGDASVLDRLVRRGMAHRMYASRFARIHGPSGFVEGTPAVEALRTIVAAFAARARREGKLPVVVLFENVGYRDHVYRALKPVLERDTISYVDTHPICPDTEPLNFLPDGHFNGPSNKKIAMSLLNVIRGRLREDKWASPRIAGVRFLKGNPG